MPSHLNGTTTITIPLSAYQHEIVTSDDRVRAISSHNDVQLVLILYADLSTGSNAGVPGKKYLQLLFSLLLPKPSQSH
jgi:hypothetical protein